MAYTRNFKKYEAPVIVKMPRVIRAWSDYQKAIFNDIENGTGNTQVDALAGTGKTSTLVEGFYYVPKGLSTLFVAFNKSIQVELEARAPEGTTVKTLHGLGYAAVRRAFPRITKPDQNKLRNFVIAEVGDDNNYELRTMIEKTVSLSKGYLAEEATAIDEVMDRHDVDTGEMNREQFIACIQKVMNACKMCTSSIDFDDMVWFPNVHNLKLDKYDRVFVDEAQDLNSAQINLALDSIKANGKILSAGDQFQCVDINTNMSIENGTTKTAGVLQKGDRILSYRNGKNMFQTISNIWESKETEGYKITTESGKQLTMTALHQIWASLPVFSGEGEDTLTYLMYRKGFGFRIGMTNKCYDVTGIKNISSRLNQEGGDKMWILDWSTNRTDAHFKEISYSLKYGIPTCVFRGEERGLDQNYINNIFSEFGENGFELIEDKKLSFHHPHWMAYSAINRDYVRNVIQCCEHSEKGTYVTLEWTETECQDKFIPLLNKEKIAFQVAKGENRFRIRKFCRINNEALLFARKLAELFGLEISRTLSNNETRLNLLTASALFVGMKVPVKNGDKFKLEKIVSIEKVISKFVDIEVDDASNFYGNDILSHNCIYSFRGADSNAINNIVERLNAKRLPLSMTYRCAKSIVALAKTLVPAIECPDTAEDGLVAEIAINRLPDMVKPGDFVLSRTNAPLLKWCLHLLKSHIPANIQGRDVGENLISLIKKSHKTDIDGFLDWLHEYQEIEVARMTKQKRDSSVVSDKVECMEVLCEGMRTLADVKDNIKKLFADGDDKSRVIFSTTHKAKGLERDRVFMLRDTYRPSKGQEEANLAYVAYTRAKKELYLVAGK